MLIVTDLISATWEVKITIGSVEEQCVISACDLFCVLSAFVTNDKLQWETNLRSSWIYFRLFICWEKVQIKNTNWEPWMRNFWTISNIPSCLHNWNVLPRLTRILTHLRRFVWTISTSLPLTWRRWNGRSQSHRWPLPLCRLCSSHCCPHPPPHCSLQHHSSLPPGILPQNYWSRPLLVKIVSQRLTTIVQLQ